MSNQTPSSSKQNTPAPSSPSTSNPQGKTKVFILTPDLLKKLGIANKIPNLSTFKIAGNVPNSTPVKKIESNLHTNTSVLNKNSLEIKNKCDNVEIKPINVEQNSVKSKLLSMLASKLQNEPSTSTEIIQNPTLFDKQITSNEDSSSDLQEIKLIPEKKSEANKLSIQEINLDNTAISTDSFTSEKNIRLKLESPSTYLKSTYSEIQKPINSIEIEDINKTIREVDNQISQKLTTCKQNSDLNTEPPNTELNQKLNTGQTSIKIVEPTKSTDILLPIIYSKKETGLIETKSNRNVLSPTLKNNDRGNYSESIQYINSAKNSDSNSEQSTSSSNIEENVTIYNKENCSTKKENENQIEEQKIIAIQLNTTPTVPIENTPENIRDIKATSVEENDNQIKEQKSIARNKIELNATSTVPIENTPENIKDIKTTPFEENENQIKEQKSIAPDKELNATPTVPVENTPENIKDIKATPFEENENQIKEQKSIAPNKIELNATPTVPIENTPENIKDLKATPFEENENQIKEQKSIAQNKIELNATPTVPIENTPENIKDIKATPFEEIENQIKEQTSMAPNKIELNTTPTVPIENTPENIKDIKATSVKENENQITEQKSTAPNKIELNATPTVPIENTPENIKDIKATSVEENENQIKEQKSIAPNKIESNATPIENIPKNIKDIKAIRRGRKRKMTTEDEEIISHIRKSSRQRRLSTVLTDYVTELKLHDDPSQKISKRERQSTESKQSKDLTKYNKSNEQKSLKKVHNETKSEPTIEETLDLTDCISENIATEENKQNNNSINNTSENVNKSNDLENLTSNSNELNDQSNKNIQPGYKKRIIIHENILITPPKKLIHENISVPPPKTLIHENISVPPPKALEGTISTNLKNILYKNLETKLSKYVHNKSFKTNVKPDTKKRMMVSNPGNQSIDTKQYIVVSNSDLKSSIDTDLKSNKNIDNMQLTVSNTDLKLSKPVDLESKSCKSIDSAQLLINNTDLKSSKTIETNLKSTKSIDAINDTDLKLSKTIEFESKSNTNVDSDLKCSKSIDADLKLSRTIDIESKSSKSIDSTLLIVNNTETIGTDLKSSKSIDADLKLSKTIDIESKSSKSIDTTQLTVNNTDLKSSKSLETDLKFSKTIDTVYNTDSKLTIDAESKPSKSINSAQLLINNTDLKSSKTIETNLKYSKSIDAVNNTDSKLNKTINIESKSSKSIDSTQITVNNTDLKSSKTINTDLKSSKSIDAVNNTDLKSSKTIDIESTSSKSIDFSQLTVNNTDLNADLKPSKSSDTEHALVVDNTKNIDIQTNIKKKKKRRPPKLLNKIEWDDASLFKVKSPTRTYAVKLKGRLSTESVNIEVNTNEKSTDVNELNENNSLKPKMKIVSSSCETPITAKIIQTENNHTVRSIQEYNKSEISIKPKKLINDQNKEFNITAEKRQTKFEERPLLNKKSLSASILETKRPENIKNIESKVEDTHEETNSEKYTLNKTIISNSISKSTHSSRDKIIVDSDKTLDTSRNTKEIGNKKDTGGHEKILADALHRVKEAENNTVKESKTENSPATITEGVTNKNNLRTPKRKLGRPPKSKPKELDKNLSDVYIKEERKSFDSESVSLTPDSTDQLITNKEEEKYSDSDSKSYWYTKRRPRGRPRKYKIEEITPIETDTTNRELQRNTENSPSITFENIEEQNTNSKGENLLLTPPKKRGRKTKQKIIVDPEAQILSPIEKPTPRMPGRPPKSKTDTLVENISTRGKKRKRDDSNKTNSAKEVTCAICQEVVKKISWPFHTIKHNFLCWHLDEPAIDLNDKKLVQYVLTKSLKNLRKHFKYFTCDTCGDKKKSVLGFMSHLDVCQLTDEEREALMITCDICNKKVLPQSMKYHMSVHKQTKIPEKVIEKNNDDLNSIRSKRKAATKAVNLIQEVTNNELGRSKPNKEDFIITGKKRYKKGSDPGSIFFNYGAILKLDMKFRQGFKKCLFPNCTFTSDDFSKLKNHLSSCSFLKSDDFVCKLCLHVEQNESAMLEHVNSTHIGLEVFVSSSESDDGGNEDEIMPATEVMKKRTSGFLRQSSDYIKPTYKVAFLRKERRRTSNKVTSFLPALKWTAEFRKKNYYKETFKDILCLSSKWIPVSLKDQEEYMPLVRKSMSVKTCSVAYTFPNVQQQDHEWKEFDLFESNITNDTVNIFCGGPVWAFAWIPTPEYQICDQYLAVSVQKDFEATYKISESYSGKEIIQFWNFGPLQSNRKNVDPPTLDFTIAHNHGMVWCMEWCPSGYYDLEKPNGDKELQKLGLLALACSDGNISIYSIGKPQREDNNHNMFLVKPVYKLILQESSEQPLGQWKYQATRISWSKHSNHNIIAGGYTNGVVSLWDLTTTSPLLKSEEDGTIILRPYHSFQAHSSAVSALILYPLIDKGQRWLLTGSWDRTFKYWDLNNTSAPFSSFGKRGIITDGVWISHWLCSFFAFDDVFSFGHTVTAVQNPRDFAFKQCSALASNSVVMSMSSSDWASAVAQASLAGELTGSFPRTILMSYEIDKTLKCKRMLMSYNEIIDKTKKISERKDIMKVERKSEKLFIDKDDRSFTKYLNNHDLEPYVEEPTTYVEAIKKYGLVFCDLEMEKISTFPEESFEIVKQSNRLREAPTELYPITSLNRVAWNPNKQAYLYIVCGYQNGFVRLRCVRFMNAEGYSKSNS